MCAPAPESFYCSPFPGAHCALGLELLADFLPRAFRVYHVIPNPHSKFGLSPSLKSSDLLIYTPMMFSLDRQLPQLAGTHLTLPRGLRPHFLLDRDGAEQKERVPGDVGLDAAESDSGSKWEVSYTGGIAVQKM